MEQLPTGEDPRRPQGITPEAVRGLLGATATRHVLYLLDGQYLYQSQAENGSIQYKFLSAESVRLAFSHEQVDSGWLAPEILRWGYSGNGQWVAMFVPPAFHTLWLPAVAGGAGTHTEPTNLAEYQAVKEGLVAVKVPIPAFVFA